MLFTCGCFGTRHIDIKPHPASTQHSPIPLSVRMEVPFDQNNGETSSITPISVDFKKAFLAYAKERGTFREVSDAGLEDLLLQVKSLFRLGTVPRFEYTFMITGILLRAKDGAPLGQYRAFQMAPGGDSRFSTEADRGPVNKAFNAAMDEIFEQIEGDGQNILAKFSGRAPAASPITEPSTPPAASPAPPAATAPARVVRSDIDNLPRVDAVSRKAHAVVIGIEKYRQHLPAADFASGDARLVSKYLTMVLGYPPENVATLIGDSATKSDFEKYFERWLPNRVQPGDEVFVFFSGHGSPNPKTDGAYLVPYDGDPTYLEQTGYPLNRLYAQLAKLPAKNVTVVLDSCFSGAGGRSVLAKGAKPLVTRTSNESIPANITVLTASAGDQISYAYDEKGHGLFTYFLLKGIAQQAINGSVKIKAAFDFAAPQVSRIARQDYNNDQVPQWKGAQ